MTVSKASAYHEAAHAVAVVLCGEAVHSLSAFRHAEAVTDRRGRDSGPVLGLMESTLSNYPPDMVRHLLAAPIVTDPASIPADAPPPPSADDIRRGLWRTALNNVFVSGAGAAGEARASRRSLMAVWLGPSVSGDLLDARRTLEPFMSAEAAEPLIWKAWDRVAKAIMEPRAWRAVAAVGDALRSAGGRLDGETVNETIWRALGERPAYGAAPLADIPVPVSDAQDAAGERAQGAEQ